ncbi:MAG: phenylalanine--tRNA ligase subunit beta [Oscillatoriaceae cyanobacterium]
MRISLNWLRELVDIKMSPSELADMLTMAGFEVEDIEDRRSWADGVVVGKVLQCDRHPNADKLSVCVVEIGSGEPLNIVCGAANVRADIYVPVATVGTYLPRIDIKIKKAKLRGVPSEGMICSLAELGLTKESAGIHIFAEENLPLGSDVRPLLGLDDTILDLTSTANRADALSMVGVAREVAALTGATVRLPKAVSPTIEANNRNLSITIKEPTACSAYIGTVIEGVKIAPSPAWLQQRLQASGMRPINNVVDVTNYVLLEWGQPLHAFDDQRLQALAGTNAVTISVRYAKAGESLKTLDGQTRTLQADQSLVITANDRPVALAGVMGGEETEVDQSSTNLILEAALFESAVIRRSARGQGLRSESSTRYERGVNQAGLEIACYRAVKLITELAGGVVRSSTIADHRPPKTAWTKSVELRLDRVNQILGRIKKPDGTTGTLAATDIERILKALECRIEPTQKPIWFVTPPPYRARDLEREIDLIEEIARLTGYNNFCDTLPSQGAFGYLPESQKQLRHIRAAFRAAGLTELMHYSLVSRGSENQIVLTNPLFAEYSALRTEMISAQINAFAENQNQGNGPLNGFEIGRIFWQEDTQMREKDVLAGILGGDSYQGRWVRSGKEQPLTWFEAKGIIESVFSRLGVTAEYQPLNLENLDYKPILPPEFCRPTLHPGRTANLMWQGKHLGIFGQLHPQLRQERELPAEVYVFQLDLDVFLEAITASKSGKFQAYATVPGAPRDIAFFSPVEMPVADIANAITKAGGDLLESVELFDEYRGENVPAGQRSLAFRLVYRASDKTLTEADIEPVHQKVRDTISTQLGLTLRS